MSWEEYICSIDRYIHLGRPMVCKESRRHFKATLAMVRLFLITVSGEKISINIVLLSNLYPPMYEFFSNKEMKYFVVKISFK